ncbi:MAG: hypothetical protein ACI4HJ_04980 [Ruminococcus sp.]
MAKKVFTEAEARERKNARQREYAKRTGYAASAKYEKDHVKRYVVKLVDNTDQELIDWLEKQDNKAGYIKGLIRDDFLKSKK